jgi:phage-related protein (TIGR01555 family)
MAKSDDAAGSQPSFHNSLTHAVGGVVKGLVGSLVNRIDSWENAFLGFGGQNDKTMGGRFRASRRLTDAEITAMFENDDYSARIVETFPREELGRGWSLDGDLSPEEADDAKKWLEKKWRLTALVGEARVWGRAYGGCVLWFGTADGDMSQPLPEEGPISITFIRVVDRRYIQPVSWYTAGPLVGEPEHYILTDASGHALQGSFKIHESRVVRFGGARTNAQTKAALQGWDLSVLQRPYDALRSEGVVWKATETLVSDSNQGVYKIKNLFGMVAGGQKDKLIERIQIMDLGRSVGKSILLDADFEEFERQPTNFAGLKDLNEAGQLRVASAAEIPVTILLGQAPAGLNATGDADIRNFQSRVSSDRPLFLEPQMLRAVRLCLRDAESPVAVAEDDDLSLCWPPMWQPTAGELATMRLQRAQEAQIYIVNQVLLPEEVAVSLDQDTWQFSKEAREKILKDDANVLAMLSEAKEAKEPPAVDENGDPVGEDDEQGKPAAKEKPEKPPVKEKAAP